MVQGENIRCNASKYFVWCSFYSVILEFSLEILFGLEKKPNFYMFVCRFLVYCLAIVTLFFSQNYPDKNTCRQFSL